MTNKLLPVTFVVYNTLAFGKNKGKVDPRSLHTVKLMRDPSKGETVADTIKRLKLMYSSYHVEGTGKHQRVVIDEPMRQRFKLEMAPETDEERIARYERDGLEVISVTDGVTTVEAVQYHENEPHALSHPELIAVGDAEVEVALEVQGL